MLGKWKKRFSELWQTGNELAFSGQGQGSNCVGITISADFIKLLKIKLSNNQYTIENFDIARPPHGAMVKNEIKDPAAIAKIVKDIYSRSQVTAKDVALCIPRSLAIVRNMTVDSRFTMDEIESRVWIEASRLFPKLIEDVYLDFAVVGPSAHDMTKLDILLVACRKDIIKPYLEAIHLSGLNVRIIDVNYFALERALALIAKQSPELKTLALLNITFTFIDLIVIHEGESIYTHEVSYDGSHLKKIIENMQNQQSNSSSDASQIEMLKRNLGMQMKHAIQFFYSSRPTIRIQRIILAGDCSVAIPDLANYVQSEVGKEVVLANPFKEMELTSAIDQEKLKKYSSALMLCCGLALRKSD